MYLKNRTKAPFFMIKKLSKSFQSRNTMEINWLKKKNESPQEKHKVFLSFIYLHTYTYNILIIFQTNNRLMLTVMNILIIIATKRDVNNKKTRSSMKYYQTTTLIIASNSSLLFEQTRKKFEYEKNTAHRSQPRWVSNA